MQEAIGIVGALAITFAIIAVLMWAYDLKIVSSRPKPKRPS